MRIGRMRVVNILGCREAEIDLSQQAVTIIGGKNYQGKSSFLTGLDMSLGGARAFPKNPITDGEEEGEIELELIPAEDGSDEGGPIPYACTVHRMLVEKDPELGEGFETKVEILDLDEDEDGRPHKASEPQTKLNELNGDGLMFDPLAFVRSKASAQADTLRDLVGIDYAELDTQREKLYQKRATVNKEVKIVDGQIKGLKLPDNVPQERADVEEIMGRLKAANAHNANIERGEDRCEQLRNKIAAVNDRIAELRQEVERLVDENNERIEKETELSEELETLERFDTSPIEAEIQAASEVNRLHDLQDQAIELRAQRRDKQRESRRFTKAMEKIDKEKAMIASEAQWPIDGLGFDTGGVTYQGRPFSSCSSAEQLRCAVAIAIRKNPQFPVAVIRDGSLLDEESLIELTKTVVELRGQCLVEIVTEPAKTVVEDGQEMTIPGTDGDCHLLFQHGKGTVQ